MDGRVDTGWDASKFEANPEPAPEAPFPLSDFQPDYTLPPATLAEPSERSLGHIEPKQKFGDAFVKARQSGLKEFEWGGKRYSTETREEAAIRAAGREAKKPADKPAAATEDDGWSLAAFGVQEPAPVVNGSGVLDALHGTNPIKKRISAAERKAAGDSMPVVVKPGKERAYSENLDAATIKRMDSGAQAEIARIESEGTEGAAKIDAIIDQQNAEYKAAVDEERNNPLIGTLKGGFFNAAGGLYGAIGAVAQTVSPDGYSSKRLAKIADDNKAWGNALLSDVSKSDFSDADSKLEWMLHQSIANAPSYVTTLASIINPALAPYALGTMGAYSGGGHYRDLINQGADHDVAAVASVGYGALEALIERAVPVEIGQEILKRARAMKPLAQADLGKRVLRGVGAAAAATTGIAVGEGFEELVTGIGQRTIDKVAAIDMDARGKSRIADKIGKSDIFDKKTMQTDFMGGVAGGMAVGSVVGGVGGRDAARASISPQDQFASAFERQVDGAEFAPLPDAGIGQDGPGQADYEAAMRQAFGGATQPGATTAPDAVSLAPTQVAPPPPSGPVTAALQEAMPTMPPAAAEQPWRNQSFSDLLAQDAADPLVRPENMLPVEDAEPMPEMSAASADQDWAPMPAMPSMPDGQEWTPMPASPEMAEDQPLETNDIEWANQLPVDAAENAEPESGIFSDQSQADAEPQDDWLNRFISEDTGTEEAASDPVFSAAFNDLPDEPGLIANQEADAPPESSVEPGVMAEAPPDNIATDDTAPAESGVFVSGVDGFDDDELLRQAEAAATNDKGDPDASTEMAAFGREGQSDQPQGSQADRGTGGRSESTAGDRHAGRTETSVGTAVSVGDALPGSAALAEEAVYPAEEATIEAQEMGGDTQTRSGYSVFSPSITSISVNQETDGIGSGDTTIINQFDPVDEKREIGDIATLPTTNTEAATTLEAALRGTGNPAIDLAANAAASSPLNAVPEPTEAQKKAGNYAVGRVRLHGMDISIENPAGSIRSGTDSDGERWETEMQSHYGYIRNSTGRDKDHIDVFLSQGADTARTAWVIDQINQDGTFDEHKIVIGPDTEAEARDAYLANYDPGWMGLGAITPMAMDDFKTWVFDKKKTRKPVAYKKPSTRLTAHDDPRIAQYADTLRELARQTGWAQTGGRIYRNPDTGEVDGRTAWIPNAEWYPNLSERLSGGDAVSAVEAAISGASMSVRQKRFVSDLLDVAESYANVDTEDHDPDSAAEAAAERAAIQATEDLIVEMDDSDLDALIDAAWNAEPTERRELSDEEIDELFGAPSEEAPGTASAEGAVTVGQDEGDNRGSDSDWTTGDAEEVAFDLTGQTPEQAMAEEQAIADAKKAEQDAADKAEAEAKKARISAEVASRQQASAENFQLGQSAEDALSGQGDIFGGLTQQEATNEQQSIEQLREKLRKIEDKILLAAGERDNIEQAMSSRKVGKSLKDERNAIRDQVRTAQKRLDDAQKQTATSTETPAGQPAATTFERYEAGSKLTKEERKSVLKTLTDVYRAKRADKEERISANGETYLAYPHQPELFEKSDITGKMVRFYVTLPDGRIAHPTELFPDYSQADVDLAIAKQADEERVSDDNKKYRIEILNRRMADSLNEANRIFNKENPSRSDYVPAILTNGRQFIRTAPENAAKDIELLGKDWRIKEAEQEAKPSEQTSKTKWIKAVVDQNRLSTGAKIGKTATSELTFFGDPRSTKQGRALLGAYEEAKKAGATDDEILQATGATTFEVPNIKIETGSENFLEELYSDATTAQPAQSAEESAQRTEPKTGAKIDDFGEKLGGESTLSANAGDSHSALFQKTLEASMRGAKAFSDLLNSDAFLGELDNLLKIKFNPSSTLKTAQAVDSDAAPGKSGLKSVRTHAQSLRDIIGSNTILQQGLSGVDAETQRLVFSHVLALGKNLQVFDSVIQLIPVDVVDNLRDQELAPDSLLNDPSVFKRAVTGELRLAVPAVKMPDALIRAIALAGAEIGSGRIVPDLVRPALDRAAAGGALNGNHGVNDTRNDRQGKTKETESGVTMLSRAAPVPWFSPLHKAVQSAPDRIFAKGAQVKLWLVGNKAKLGLKDDEIQWSGINDYLDLRGKDKVTKAEVLDYLSGNGVQVDDVVKGVVDEGDVDVWWNDEGGANEEVPYGELSESERLAATDRYVDEVGRYAEEGATKFSGYWDSSYKGGIPGTYREILVTLPAKTTANQSRAEYEEWARRKGYSPNATFTEEKYKQETGKDAPPPRSMSAMGADRSANFKSSHWDEPNVLVHVRLDEVTGADGKRYVRVGEVQSDWGQKGKKEGFNTPVKGYQVVVDGNPLTIYETRDEADAHVARAAKYGGSAEVKEVTARRNVQQAAGLAPTAPFVTDTKAWVALGIKRAIIHAAQVGADGVVFGTGQQNADLYDLSKQVDEIRVERADDGTRTVAVDAAGDRSHIFMDVDDSGTVTFADSMPELNGKALADVIGKEMAEKVMSVGGDAAFSGDGLKVGGEGMRAFYDKIVPSVANEVLRKIGGGKVGEFAIAGGINTLDEEIRRSEYADGTQSVEWGGNQREFETEAEAKEFITGLKANTTQPGFTLSEELRAKIDADGMPMFSRQSTGGMALRDLKAVAARVQRANKNMPTLHVLASPENLDRNDETQKRLYDFLVKNDALKDVEGATHEGEIYVFASGVADEFRAEHILAIHEPTHYGLRSVYGHELDSVLQLIYASNATVRQKADALIRSDVDSNVGAVEEVLADMTPAELVKLRGWRRLVRTLRDWFREHGFTAIANRLDGWLKSGLTDQAKADLYVADVVNAAREWVKNGKRMGFAADGTNLQRVWHGTPHIWAPEPGFPHGRPRLDKMGTGEGAQAYGWGWYSAESQGVAKSYQDTLVKNKLFTVVSPNGDIVSSKDGEPGMETLVLILLESDGTFDKARKSIMQWSSDQDSAEQLSILDSLERRGYTTRKNEEGSLYQLDIPDEVLPYLLDWDRPLSEQTKEVKARIEPAINWLSNMPGFTEAAKLSYANKEATGREFYNALVGELSRQEGESINQKAASEYLASLGIVGNRYLDGQSRNRPLKDIKREFLSELPEDADTGEVAELIGTGKFSPKNDALLRALVADDWLGFDYPAQAVSAALSKDLSGYDASPELIRTVEDAKEGGTYNYVIWDQPTLDRIALLERNGERLDAMREADAPLSMDQDRGPGADLTKQPTMPGSEFIKGADGKPLAVWHGSGEAFDTFKFTDDIGFHFGSKEAAQERLDQTGQSGVVRSFKLRLSNPLKLKHDPGEWKIREFVSALPDNVVDAISEKINNAEDEYIDGAGELSDWLGENRKDHEYLRNEIIELGYDGIAYRNSFEGGTSYVVFHDHQIESANDQPHLQQGNDSRFNRSGQSTGRDTSLSRSGQSTGAAPSLPSETVFRKLQRIGQDSMNRFTVIQDWLAEQGVADLPYGRMDVYRSEERMHGKIASRIEDFREKRLTPLIKRIHKAGFEMDQVAEYLHANHAIERNEQIERINKAAVDVNGDRNGSGMTDAEAAAVLSTYQALPNFSEFEALAEEVRSITDSTKRILLGAGIISQDQADAWDAAYKHYVPLRGNDEGGTASGKGLSVNAKSEHKRAMGHGDRESGEWIVENIIHAHERAIYLAEKNVVGKHLLTLAASVPNADLWTVSKPAKRGVIMPGQVAFAVAYKGNVVASFNTKAEAESFVNQSVMSNTARAKSNYTVNRTVGDPQVVYMASGQLADNEVQVYVKGHAVRIQLIDPLLANAYKRLGQENLTGIMALGRDINNFLSRAYTGLAPEFIVTNVQRDLLSGMVNILGEEGATVAARSLKNWPEAMYRMSRFSVTGNGDPWFNSYRESGGSTGGAYIGDLDRIGREVQATYDEAIGVFRMFRENRTGKASLLAAKKLLHAFTFWIEHMNAAAEGGMRLAAYRAKIETEAKRLGVTADVLRDEKSLRATVARNRAASLAKNSTVNFNRKGEKGAEINANFLFYNAAVQGSAIMAHALVKGKRKGQAWTALATLTGLAALLASQFGDDEWEEIPQHEKDRNMLIKLGDTGYVAKYSVPYGHGLAFAMGNSLHDLSQGKAAGAVGYHMASAVFENLMPRNPLGEDAKSLEDYGWTNFVPEGAFLGVKWWSNIGINRDGFGRQIMPESKYDETQPDHLKMYSTLQGSIYDKITSSTNKATGGTDTQAGSVDVSPETLQFLFESITGGLGRFAVDEANVAKLAAQGSAPEVKEVPVVRKFARERNRASDARSEFWETLGQAEDYIANRKRAVDGHDSAALENMERGHAELSKWVNTYKDDATAIRDDINEKRNDDTLSAAKKREAIREIETSSVDTFRKMRHRLDDEMDLLKE